jgi:choline kinase
VKVTFCHNPEFASTQNAVSLHLCRPAVGDRAFLKLDGDVLFHPAIVERLTSSTAPLAAAVEKRDDLGEEEMKVLVDGDRIRAFGKHLSTSQAYGESIGIERLSSAAAGAVFDALAAASAAGRTNLYYEDVYGELVSNGLDARAVDITDLPWIEVDTPDDLARARVKVSAGELEAPRTG